MVTTGHISVRAHSCPLMPFWVFAKQLCAYWVTTDPVTKGASERKVSLETHRNACWWVVWQYVCACVSRTHTFVLAFLSTEKHPQAQKTKNSARVCVCVLSCTSSSDGTTHTSPFKLHLKTDHIYIISSQTACIQNPKLEHQKVGSLSVRLLNIICSHGLFLHYSWGNTVRVSNHLFSVSNRRACEKGEGSSKITGSLGCSGRITSFRLCTGGDI